MNSLKRRHSVNPTSLASGRYADRRRARRGRPSIEALEHWTLLSNVTWVNASGGDWDTGSNWSTGQVPGPNDNVTIDLSSAGTVTHSVNQSDSVLSLTETLPRPSKS
jgi:hypothetical protein